MPRQRSGRISASPQASPPASFKCGLHATQKPGARRDWPEAWNRPSRVIQARLNGLKWALWFNGDRYSTRLAGQQVGGQIGVAPATVPPGLPARCAAVPGNQPAA